MSEPISRETHGWPMCCEINKIILSIYHSSQCNYTEGWLSDWLWLWPKALVGHLHWDCGVSDRPGLRSWRRRENTRGFSVSTRMRFLCVNRPFQRSCEVHGSSVFIFALPQFHSLYVATSAVTGWGGRKSSLSLLISPIAGKQARVITAARQSFRAEIKTVHATVSVPGGDEI